MTIIKKIAWTTIAQKHEENYNLLKILIGRRKCKDVQQELKTGIKVNIYRQKHGKRQKMALENTKKSHNYNKKQFDLHRKNIKLDVEDLVYAENGNRLNRKKSDEVRIGPYKIL